MFQEAKVGGQLVMAIAQHLSKEKMKGRDRAGREDLSVEQLVLSTFVSGGRQLMRLKLLHNLVSRPPQTLH